MGGVAYLLFSSFAFVDLCLVFLSVCSFQTINGITKPMDGHISIPMIKLFSLYIAYGSNFLCKYNQLLFCDSDRKYLV